uniref:Secreted protein n=1 Tax=Rhodosorus marinus TaxID=101924 RepID=A0A7S0BGH9_9RHOD
MSLFLCFRVVLFLLVPDSSADLHSEVNRVIFFYFLIRYQLVKNFVVLPLRRWSSGVSGHAKSPELGSSLLLQLRQSLQSRRPASKQGKRPEVQNKSKRLEHSYVPWSRVVRSTS